MSWGDWGLLEGHTAAVPWLPHRVNPDPTDPYSEHYNPDRPRLNQHPELLEDPTLPHPDDHDWSEYTPSGRKWPKKMEPNTLYRGLRLDMDHPAYADHPDMKAMKSILYGDGPPDAGLFPPPPRKGNPYPHPESKEGQQLSHHLLNFIEDVGQRGGGDQATKAHDTTNPTWMGRHWTSDPVVAEDYANPLRDDDPNNTSHKGRSLSVQLGADWDGRGEDLNRSNSGGSWGDESEINLAPGASLNVHTVGIRHPEHWDDMFAADEWHNVLHKPQLRSAVRL